MSRIQEILNKAEREGALRRTRGLGHDGGGTAAASAVAIPLRPTEAPPIAPPIAPRHVPEPPPQPIAPPVSTTLDVPEAALDRHLVSALAPQSLAAEQYRSLRTRISRAENGRALRTIIVTSPAKGDGKSVTAANLALTMAQEFQQRVLLLDTDLRQPSVHRLFGVSATPGLTDVLMGGASLDDALITIPDYHLTLLPAGAVPSHPAELLGSAGMRRVLDTLRTRFDRVILDMPPVAPLADVNIALPNADGLLMIVRAGVTPRPAIERALAGLDHAKVLGLVLNESGGDSPGDYGGYGYIAG